MLKYIYILLFSTIYSSILYSLYKLRIIFIYIYIHILTNHVYVYIYIYIYIYIQLYPILSICLKVAFRRCLCPQSGMKLRAVVPRCRACFGFSTGGWQDSDGFSLSIKNGGLMWFNIYSLTILKWGYRYRIKVRRLSVLGVYLILGYTMNTDPGVCQDLWYQGFARKKCYSATVVSRSQLATFDYQRIVCGYV